MLRGLWVLFVLVVTTTAVALPMTVVALVAPRWSDLVMRAGKLWSRILLAAAGARVTYHGLERASEHSPCIFVGNHQSMVDIWVMLCLMPASTRFVAKRELFRIPVFGWALAASGCIPIDRKKRTDAIRSLKNVAKRIRDGRSVVLFPEGTRSRDGRLQPFKKGAFHLALQAGVPIVPVAITGSFEVCPPRSLRVKPGPVVVFIEPAIDVSRFLPDDHEGLLAEVQATIERRFEVPPRGRENCTVQLETP